jgi:glycosyltransferase involved in cell wall biosynthesis
VVVPSEWYENNPMSVVEAFALGKPVIGSRIGGIPELVTPETGFLFEAGNPDSLAEAMTRANAIQTDEYEKMSDACREFARKNFSREQHLEQLMDVYQQAINRA